MNKVYCNVCDKDVVPVKGKCPNCDLVFNEDILNTSSDKKLYLDNEDLIENNNRIIEYGTRNFVVFVLKGLTFISIILGFIVSFFLSYNKVNSELNVPVFISTLLGYCAGGFMFFVLSEIVQILHDIRLKLYTKK